MAEFVALLSGWATDSVIARSLRRCDPVVIVLRVLDVGCRVTAYPVDFRTGDATPLTEYPMAQSLLGWQTALHKWLGLAVYGWTR